MRRRVWWRILLALSLFTMLTGCWDAKELEQVIYLNAMGLDYQNGRYASYAQVINFGNLGKSEGGSRMPEEVWVGRGYGRTVDMATDNLYPTSQQRISWAHIKGIMISEAALKHGQFDELFNGFERYPEIRYETMLYATRESVEQVLTARPILNLSALFSRFLNPMDIYNQYSVIHPIKMRDLAKQLHEPASTIILPYLSVTTSRWKHNIKPHPVMELDGAGFIKNKHFKGWLSSEQLLGLRWVQEGSSRAPVYLFNKEGPIAVVVLYKPKAKTKFRMVNGKPRFSIQIKASGVVVELVQQKTEQELMELAARKVEEEVRQLLVESVKIQADALGLEEKLYRKDPKLWKQLTQGKDLALDEQMLEKIDVKVSMMNAGKMKLRQRH